MKIYFSEFGVTTSSRIEIVDITSEVENVVARSGIKNGVCIVHLPHATAALMLNEAETRLWQDYLRLVKEIFKPDWDWQHNIIDSNAHAHLASGFIGQTRILPIKDGRLVRGTWQNILLLELDGPRHRRVVVEVMGE
ncbi:MAG TPA: YjbQ family protein [Pyrodictiaceae archaeon]|nr:YjbQ family protein [Pyrodictiaceae archaeon]HIQ11199.1 YjbQ family protein [Pyrodictium sp.]HIQ55449.1 YjbQ family protein [Pyrodictium sp.]